MPAERRDGLQSLDGERRRHVLRRLEGGAARVCGEAAPLRPPVSPEEMGRDSEEPGSGRRLRAVVPPAEVECPREGLGRDLVGELVAATSLCIGVDGAEVPVEDDPEGARLVERPQDDVCVVSGERYVRGAHAPYCPWRARGFPLSRTR